MNQVFSQAFLEALPEDDIVAAFRMVDKILEESENEFVDQEQLLDAQAFLHEFGKQSKVPLPFPDPERGFSKLALIQLRSKLSPLAVERTGTAAKKAQAVLVADFVANRKRSVIVYEFTDEDYGRIQELINRLREAAADSSELSPEHRDRVLRRIEAVQRELNKEMRTLDQLIMMVYDASVASRKVATEALKWVAIVRAISEILSATAMRSEGLSNEFLHIPGLSQQALLSSSGSVAENSVD